MTLTIAVIGRPNVGKSTFFNRLIGYRRTIVADEEGVTRDPVESWFVCNERTVCLVDTGGYRRRANVPFSAMINEHVRKTVARSDGCVLVVDGRAGLDPDDRHIYEWIMAQGKPLVIAVNKVDVPDQDKLTPFYALSAAEAVPISAEHGVGMADLFDALFTKLAPELVGRHIERMEREELPIAIVGRPNVGKSSLLNAILKEERLIVSDIAGTTRDSIDLRVEREGKCYLLIDTAGVRRTASRFSAVEHYAMLRAKEAIDRSKIAVCLIDAAEGLGTQEMQLLDQIEKAGKSCILFVNKWDLIDGIQMEKYRRELVKVCSFLEDCCIVFGSAKTGRNVTSLFTRFDEITEKMKTKITTGELNRFVERAMQTYYPPVVLGKRLRIFYLTQVSTWPLSFVLFVNDRELIVESYMRFLKHQLAESYNITGVPIRFHARNRANRGVAAIND